MARDRLAAMRNNNYAQEPAPPSSRQTNQPHNGNHDDKLSSTKESGNIDSYEMKEKYLDMPSFMDEVSSLNDGIRTVNENVDRVKDFHNRLLSELDEQQHQSISNQLATLTSDTSRLTKNLKNRIHSLQLSISHNQAQFNNGDANVRATQIGALKKRLMDSLMKYQSVEQESRQKYKSRMERQYKIVKPDATPEEIRQAVDSDDGGQIFSQALMTSNRYGDARAAFNEVKERHEDVKRIEQTITELMEMFNDLATMVEEQDQLIQNVENNAGEIQRDVEQAGQHITKARDSAASARRKRWICFFVMILILAIVAAIIAIVVVTQRKNNTIVATSTPSTQARA
ncbi:hypothetical protein MJO29_002294 [Puccinia striiformis f. sp. tritici]|uniref:t-SNARE coiled-coil homology domain-containing protein n=1 Tax=Puccinia striiformis f. sp. tritici PST-78 TaxID=1165861 RepID=A0A0L0W3E5_9BASI|nr:hypothetical protein Pst134EA_002563 [Puccinia striiformis f. sp. tritici]KAI9610002.1 hypothetical protein H4Q26_006994 [Puccinia striiformis f. sp. tritici PST-130]KNF06026.1 hypothetical protein PSTG_01019 [Puccinia striiformis f. sp. tritici PST-78]KAH9464153.1 hypothetical protein Pst134EB_003687 [Puccinia striiformis f. sp. tritici]KAH9471934.1 hypothetical protein Pst134EA_002563 [Puccinia striiformis f. sp. tritici]KAI7966546.1 hypothetical protein MJO29_002294 [Puccinia striiformis